MCLVIQVCHRTLSSKLIHLCLHHCAFGDFNFLAKFVSTEFKIVEVVLMGIVGVNVCGPNNSYQWGDIAGKSQNNSYQWGDIAG